MDFCKRLRPGAPVFGLLLIFLLQWLLLFWPRVPEWDAAFYYAYARSLAFDQDLHLDNDLLLAYPYVNEHFRGRHLDPIDEQRTVTGRVDAPFAIGTSLLWAVGLFLLRPLAHLLVESTGPLTGYEWPFVITINAASAVIGLLAFWVGYRLTRQVVGEKLAAAAALTLMFTTPMLYYQYREPIYSHAASALITGLVVLTWWRLRPQPLSWRNGAILGVLIGLAALVRWQHLIYLSLPAVAALWDWAVLPADKRGPAFKQAMIYGVAIGAAAFLVFLPQMGVWKLFYGSWVTVPQGDPYMVWTPTFFWPTLISPYRGLFTWMPIILFVFIGLFALSYRSPRTYIPLILILFLEIYVNSSTRDWFGGGGFGPRRFTSELVILLLGYAGFLQLLQTRWPGWGHRVLIGMLGFFLGWQQWILLRYGLREQLGGRTLSMWPDYRWQELSLGEFGQQIITRAGSLWTQPADFFIFPGSPLAHWQQTGGFPWSWLLLLGGVGLVAAATVQLIKMVIRKT